MCPALNSSQRYSPNQNQWTADYTGKKYKMDALIYLPCLAL